MAGFCACVCVCAVVVAQYGKNNKRKNNKKKKKSVEDIMTEVVAEFTYGHVNSDGVFVWDGKPPTALVNIM